MTEEIYKRLEKLEEFVGVPKGAIEPPVGTVTGSVSGPLLARPEKEDLDLDELLRKLQAYIDDAISQAIANFVSDMPPDVYELFEEYITNTTIINKSGGTTIRRAFVKTTPGAVSAVACYLDTDNSDTEVSVNCAICNGSALNSASPRLADGDDMLVAKIGANWWCLTIFQTSETC